MVGVTIRRTTLLCTPQLRTVAHHKPALFVYRNTFPGKYIGLVYCTIQALFAVCLSGTPRQHGEKPRCVVGLHQE